MVLKIDRSAGNPGPRFGSFHDSMEKRVRVSFLGSSFYRYSLTGKYPTFIWGGHRELVFALIKRAVGDGVNDHGVIFSDALLSRSGTNDGARWVGFGMSFCTLYNFLEQEAHRVR